MFYLKRELELGKKKGQKDELKQCKSRSEYMERNCNFTGTIWLDDESSEEPETGSYKC